MATRFAIASGNWSNTAIWDNGALPQPGDDVYANGFTVAIDQNVTVRTIRNGISPIIVPNISTPPMTSNASPSGVVNANASSSSAYLAFNQDGTSTFWQSGLNTQTGWLSYQFTSGKIIKRYAISVANNATATPRDWTFQGSNDYSTWTTLDTVTASSVGANGTYISSVLANTTSYLYYRVNITACNSATTGNYVSEIQMTESSGTILGNSSGGSFTLAGSFTINADVILSSTTAVCLNYTASSPVSATINGNITASLATAATTGYAISHSGTGTLTINGSLIGGTNGFPGNLVSCNTSTGILNINGNLIGYNGSSGGTPYMINATSAFTINIVGDINLTNAIAGGGRVLYAINLAAICTVNIIGDIIGSASGSLGVTYGIYSTAASTISITGDLSGMSNTAFSAIANLSLLFSSGPNANVTITGSVNGNNLIYSTAIITLNITGSVTGVTNSAVYHTGGGAITVTGPIIASSASGITTTSATCTCTLTGPFINTSTGISALQVIKSFITSTPTKWVMNNMTGTDRSIYTSDFPNDYPSQYDVRSGVSYNSGAMIGTMAVPPASSVASGVPVDATTGTAFITSDQVGQAVWDYLITNIADPNSIGYRLKDASTVTTTGSQIQALNGL